jgi:hypothetical protein
MRIIIEFTKYLPGGLDQLFHNGKQWIDTVSLGLEKSPLSATSFLSVFFSSLTESLLANFHKTI